MTDLLDLAATLIDLPSVSRAEAPVIDYLANHLSGLAHLELDRVGDNLVARTRLGRTQRLILAGHTDTVPPQDNQFARRDGDRLWGLGSVDMKSDLAVMLDLARSVTAPAVDVTYVFYAREEIAAEHSGLGELLNLRPDLVAGDAAIIGEPTNAQVEAGCQGTLRVMITLRGKRAHTARAWMGVNAVHRLAGLLTVMNGYKPRQPVLDGLMFHEGLQAVGVEGGVAGNVVPDEVRLLVNHRYAPDRSGDEALNHVLSFFEPHVGPGDEVTLEDRSDGAFPGATHALLSPLVERFGCSVHPKLGWTDVARFAGVGIPAVNFGPGDPLLAHAADEWVDGSEIRRVHEVLDQLLRTGATG